MSWSISVWPIFSWAICWAPASTPASGGRLPGLSGFGCAPAESGHSQHEHEGTGHDLNPLRRTAFRLAHRAALRRACVGCRAGPDDRRSGMRIAGAPCLLRRIGRGAGACAITGAERLIRGTACLYRRGLLGRGQARAGFRIARWLRAFGIRHVLGRAGRLAGDNHHEH